MSVGNPLWKGYRRAQITCAVEQWLNGNKPELYDVRRWLIEDAGIDDCLELLRTHHDYHSLDGLAQGQIQAILAKQAHDHITSLKLPPILRDYRFLVATGIAVAALIVSIFR